MCNKYQEHSKTKDYSKKDLVDKCNLINTDYTGKIKNKQCLVCRNGCPDMQFKLTGECNNFNPRMTLRELNREISIQNVNLRKLCKKHGLKYGKLKDMLSNRRALLYDYYTILENRLNEKYEFIEYIQKEA